MSNQTTNDKRFLTELVDRADRTPRDHIRGRDIAEAIGIPSEDAADTVTRLRDQGMVEFTDRPRKSSEGNDSRDIRPSMLGRSSIGRGV